MANAHMMASALSSVIAAAVLVAVLYYNSRIIGNMAEMATTIRKLSSGLDEVRGACDKASEKAAVAADRPAAKPRPPKDMPPETKSKKAAAGAPPAQKLQGFTPSSSLNEAYG